MLYIFLFILCCLRKSKLMFTQFLFGNYRWSGPQTCLDWLRFLVTFSVTWPVNNSSPVVGRPGPETLFLWLTFPDVLPFVFGEGFTLYTSFSPSLCVTPSTFLPLSLYATLVSPESGKFCNWCVTSDCDKCWLLAGVCLWCNPLCFRTFLHLSERTSKCRPLGHSHWQPYWSPAGHLKWMALSITGWYSTIYDDSK